MGNEFLGTVKWFDERKGYGFIRTEGIENDIFVHYRHIDEEGYRTLVRNELVHFEITDTSRGLLATKVRKVSHGENR